VKKVDATVAMICSACLIVLFMIGGDSTAMAEEFPHLTAEQSIATARRNAKPGSSVTILWEISSDADRQRIGGQALEQAQTQKIDLFENGILINILRSGGYLLAETDPRTNNMVATHYVLLEVGGAVKDTRTECHGVVKLADVEELVKDTVDLVNQVYSTPSIDELSLASRFYAGSFPDADQFPDDLFAIPHFLRKPGAKPDKVRKAAALYWGYLFWPARYALSMPAFAANPAATGDAAEKKRDTLKADFLRRNKLDPNINLIDLDNIQSEGQLQERIELLTRLDRFLEDSLRSEADPVVIGANLSVLAMPSSVNVDLNQVGQYVSSSPPKCMFLWGRVATGGFAVKEITWDW
jgi:hypothetical protein